jgi:hypothetical protein
VSFNLSQLARVILRFIFWNFPGDSRNVGAGAFESLVEANERRSQTEERSFDELLGSRLVRIPKNRTKTDHENHQSTNRWPEDGLHQSSGPAPLRGRHDRNSRVCKRRAVPDAH